MNEPPETSYRYQRIWPSIKPKSHLTLQTPADPSTWIFLIPSLLTSSECGQLLAACTKAHPLQLSSHAQTRSVAFRDNDRSAFSSPELSDLIWNTAGLRALIEQTPALNEVSKGLRACGLNDMWRLYRYREGQRFGPHYDEEANGEGNQRGYFTLLIYLNGGEERCDTSGKAKAATKDSPKTKTQKGLKSNGKVEDDAPLEGGETVFYRGTPKNKKPVLSVAPVTGMALLHAQGGRCLLHEGAVVRKGSKWVLRSDLMYEPM
ncbi:hypothetical protein SpCBS45565_g04736 [Spizellomyces sp. 'palustris']|nr:hypothetical protein SpCBS45565_g04736 [Spizellomyces sp. 'palustris']